MSRLFSFGAFFGFIAASESTCENQVADEFTTLQLIDRTRVKTRHASPRMEFHQFDSTGDEVEDAQAGVLCGDGSIAGYYYLMATRPEDKDKWLFWFQGGQPPTSTTWPETETPISTRFGSEFATWNQIYFRTCSKDTRSGTRRTPYVDGMYYQGHLHVVKAFDEMQAFISNNHEFFPNKVIIGGCSGGSISVVANADYIASRLPPHVDIKAKIETGLYFDAVTYNDFLADDLSNPSGVDMNKENAEAMEAYVDESCRLALGEDWWKCRMFEHAAPYISIPTHFSEPKFDSWRLYEQYGFDADKNQNPSKYSSDRRSYLDYWGQRLVEVSNAVSEAQPEWGSWIPSCIAHCQGTTLEGNMSLTTSSNQISTPEEAFSNWYWQRGGEHFFVDACSGDVACNIGGWKCGRPTDCICGDDTQPLSECSASERNRVC